MDTGDLTDMAYNVLIMANNITDCLKTELGVLSAKYKNEDEYLNGILNFINKIKEAPENYFDFQVLWDELDIPFFKSSLEKLTKYVMMTLETPMEQRGKPDWD